MTGTEMSGIARRTFLQGTAASGLTLAAGGASGQTAWPNRPVKFVAPFAAGGGIDFTARALGEFVSRHIGQPVLIENRTGSGGMIGIESVMKGEPDGYTVLITSDNSASLPHIMKLPYDYTHELEPVMCLAWQPNVIAAHPSISVNSVAELVKYAKANPGLGYATSGVGSNQHIVGEWFRKEAGIPIVHVPYRGSGQAINDLLAGHVKLGVMGPTAALPQYKAGNLRILVQSSSKRTSDLPDVPTFEEAGYKGLVLESWYAAFVPKGTPPAIIERLNTEFGKALADPKIREGFASASIEILGGSPSELRTIARSGSAKFERLIRELDIKAN